MKYYFINNADSLEHVTSLYLVLALAFVLRLKIVQAPLESMVHSHCREGNNINMGGCNQN